MRPSILVFAVATTLAAAPATLAAPTCQDINGDTLKCGAPGAMPVGWVAPSRRLDRPASEPPTPRMTFSLVILVGALFALLALMPEFDGWKPGDWDRQEGDDEEAR